MTQGYFVKTG